MTQIGSSRCLVVMCAFALSGGNVAVGDDSIDKLIDTTVAAIRKATTASETEDAMRPMLEHRERTLVARRLVVAFYETDKRDDKLAILLCMGALGEDARRMSRFLEATATCERTDSMIRLYAMNALVATRPNWKQHTGFLARALQDEVLWSAATDIVSEMGPNAAELVPVIAKRAKESDGALFIELLGDIGPGAEKAVPLLVRRLASEDSAYIRVACIKSLSRIAPKRTDVHRAIVNAMTDDNADVRRVAEEALKK